MTSLMSNECGAAVIAADPALARSLVPRDAVGLVYRSMHTDNPLVIAAWEGLRDDAAPPPTGAPVFDQVMGDLGPIVLDSRRPCSVPRGRLGSSGHMCSTR